VRTAWSFEIVRVPEDQQRSHSSISESRDATFNRVADSTSDFLFHVRARRDSSAASLLFRVSFALSLREKRRRERREEAAVFPTVIRRSLCAVHFRILHFRDDPSRSAHYRDRAQCQLFVRDSAGLHFYYRFDSAALCYYATPFIHIHAGMPPSKRRGIN